MHVRQAATGVDEKGDGYPHRPVVPRENAARIQQHVRKGEFLGGQVTLDRDRSFALIDEEELHVLGISRRLRQYRHLPTAGRAPGRPQVDHARSEEHTSELQSLMRISYAVFCLNKKKK